MSTETPIEKRDREVTGGNLPNPAVFDPFLTPCGEVIASRDGTRLIVNTRRNIDEETGRAEEIIATDDGRHADLTKWHEGPEGEWVYYERIQSDGSGSHGYVDGATRQIVQAG